VLDDQGEDVVVVDEGVLGAFVAFLVYEKRKIVGTIILTFCHEVKMITIGIENL